MPSEREFVEKHEGREKHVYTDTEGHPSIGVGFNLDRPGARQQIESLGLNFEDVKAGRTDLTDTQIDSLYDADLAAAREAARETISNFDSLPADKQMVVTDMAFNLGQAGLAGFHNMIDALENEDFERAADEMVDSEWFNQVGDRAVEDVAIMSGEGS